jgi:hypothetical protein
MIILDLVSQGLFSSDMNVLHDGLLLAKLQFSTWQEKGSITGNGRFYTVRKDGMLSDHFMLQEQGQILCDATMKSLWGRTVELDHDDVHYLLKWSGWGRRVNIFREELEFGSVYGKGFFDRDARAELSEELALPLETFMLWLAVLGWNRDAAAAG